MHETPDAAVTDDPRRRDVPTGVIMVGMAAIAWWPAFSLGAWGEIFFDDILALWAASVAALVFVLVERRRLRGRLARALVLLLPSVWLALSFAAHERVTDLGVALLDLAAFSAVLIGIPFTLWVLVQIVWPDFAARTPPVEMADRGGGRCHRHRVVRARCEPGPVSHLRGLHYQRQCRTRRMRPGRQPVTAE